MLILEKILNSYKSIIFLNGDFPDKKIMATLNTHLPMIAADGAVHKMKNIDLQADVVIGDEDSISEELTSIKKIHISDQNYSDFEKCIFYAKKNNLLPALILGVSGGEIDHILGNAQVILKHATNQDLFFLDTYQKKCNSIGMKIGIPLTANKLSVFLKKQSLISLLSFDEAIVNSKGLKWELENKKLSIKDILALRNQNIQNQVEFEVLFGRVLIIFDL
jgi:thiamine pyrophosphokinase